GRGRPRGAGAGLPVGAGGFRPRAVMAALPVALPAHDGWATALRTAMAGSTLVRPADAGEEATIAVRVDAAGGAAIHDPIGPLTGLRTPGRGPAGRLVANPRPPGPARRAKAPPPPPGAARVPFSRPR